MHMEAKINQNLAPFLDRTVTGWASLPSFLDEDTTISCTMEELREELFPDGDIAISCTMVEKCFKNME